MEMGDLSRREIEPDKTIAGSLSHNGSGEKRRKSGTQAAIESTRRLATLQEAPPDFTSQIFGREEEARAGSGRPACPKSHRQPPRLSGSITARALTAAQVRGCFSCR